MDTNSRHDTAEQVNNVSSFYVTETVTSRAGTRAPASDTRGAQLDFGSGWYHDTAIAEAKEAHAHPYN